MLGRALVHTPDLLILDEPTAGVDVEQRRDLWAYLKELNESGKTIILTSHYLEEIQYLCNEIAIINHGQIIAEGTKDDLMKEGIPWRKRILKLLALVTPNNMKINLIGLFYNVASRSEANNAVVVQTLIAPVVSAALYIFIFGTVIGSRITEVSGVPYISFHFFPGILMLSVINASFC